MGTSSYFSQCVLGSGPTTPERLHSLVAFSHQRQGCSWLIQSRGVSGRCSVVRRQSPGLTNSDPDPPTARSY